MGFIVDVTPPPAFCQSPSAPLVYLIQATDLQLSSIFSLIFSPYPACTPALVQFCWHHALSLLYGQLEERAPVTLKAEINPPEVYPAVKSLQVKCTEDLRARNKKQRRDPSRLLT